MKAIRGSLRNAREANRMRPKWLADRGQQYYSAGSGSDYINIKEKITGIY